MVFSPEITNSFVLFSLNSYKPFVVTWNNAEKTVQCQPEGNPVYTLNLDGNTV